MTEQNKHSLLVCCVELFILLAYKLPLALVPAGTATTSNQILQNVTVPCLNSAQSRCNSHNLIHKSGIGHAACAPKRKHLSIIELRAQQPLTQHHPNIHCIEQYHQCTLLQHSLSTPATLNPWEHFHHTSDLINTSVLSRRLTICFRALHTFI